MEFETKITCTLTAGKYEWCGGFGRSGYRLDDKLETQNTQMIGLEIKIDQDLLDKIDIISCYDCTGFNIQYTTHTVKRTTYLYFKTSDRCDLQGTQIKIEFVKWLPRIPGRDRFRPPPKDIIHSENAYVPCLASYDSECAICLENSDNSYVTECGHSFHMNCILDYLRVNNKIVPSKCKHCKHGNYIEPFACPTCRKILEDR
jgi:hypothetical protein